jgi:hypothetical protein
MSQTVQGNNGIGSTRVFDAPALSDVWIESIRFVIDTDATAGVHMVRIKYGGPDGSDLAQLDDWNEGGPSETHFYTYALGLNGSMCTLGNLLGATDALPWTTLPASGYVNVSPIDDQGQELQGDVVSGVWMRVTYVTAPETTTREPIYFMPGRATA